MTAARVIEVISRKRRAPIVKHSLETSLSHMRDRVGGRVLHCKKCVIARPGPTILWPYYSPLVHHVPLLRHAARCFRQVGKHGRHRNTELRAEHPPKRRRWRLWHRLLGRPASESGTLCHSDAAQARGHRLPRAFMLPILILCSPGRCISWAPYFFIAKSASSKICRISITSPSSAGQRCVHFTTSAFDGASITQ